MKYYWPLFEILEICLSDLSRLDAIALSFYVIFDSSCILSIHPSYGSTKLSSATYNSFHND